MHLSLETLTSIEGNGLTILVELIRLLNSVIVFIFQITLPISLTQKVILVSIDFLSNLKGDVPFHCKDSDTVFVIIWEIFQRSIPYNLVLLPNSVSWLRFESMYISLIINIRSSFIHPLCFLAACYSAS